MRRSTKAGNYRTSLRLETLESRNVLSANAGIAVVLAVPPIAPTLTSSDSIVVQAGPCGVDIAASVGTQLANSNNAAEAVPSVTSVVTNAVATIAIVVADLPILPAPSGNIVVEPPTEVVSLPQGSIPDGVVQRRDRPFPPLVLIATSNFDAPPGSTSVETLEAEFGCVVAIKLKIPPEPSVGQDATPAPISSTPVSSVSSPGPNNTTSASSEHVSTPSGGRSYRPVTSATQPQPISTADHNIQRNMTVAVEVVQPVGAKPRRR